MKLYELNYVSRLSGRAVNLFLPKFKYARLVRFPILSEREENPALNNPNPVTAYSSYVKPKVFQSILFTAGIFSEITCCSTSASRLYS